MDGLTQSDLIDMYSQQVSQMAGSGRRRRLPARRAPLRRGRGLVGGEGFSSIPDLLQMGQPSMALDGYVLGSGLVGGARRRRKKAPKKMSAAVKAYLAARRSAGAPRRRRGRGLVGGASAQDIYDDFVDNDEPIDDLTIRLMQAGIQPSTPKDSLIRRIRSWEKKLGLSQTTAERLRKYTTAALQQILDIYVDKKDILAYPPTKEQGDLWDDDRFERPIYQARRRQPTVQASSATSGAQEFH